jgi:hypothetical protein
MLTGITQVEPARGMILRGVSVMVMGLGIYPIGLSRPCAACFTGNMRDRCGAGQGLAFFLRQRTPSTSRHT